MLQLYPHQGVYMLEVWDFHDWYPDEEQGDCDIAEDVSHVVQNVDNHYRVSYMMSTGDLVLVTFHVIITDVLKGHSVFICRVKQSKCTIGI